MYAAKNRSSKSSIVAVIFCHFVKSVGVFVTGVATLCLNKCHNSLNSRICHTNTENILTCYGGRALCEGGKPTSRRSQGYQQRLGRQPKKKKKCVTNSKTMRSLISQQKSVMPHTGKMWRNNRSRAEKQKYVALPARQSTRTKSRSMFR